VAPAAPLVAAPPLPDDLAARVPQAPSRAPASRAEGAAIAVPPHVAVWASLEEAKLKPAHLERSRLVSFQKSDPAHVAFDVLRTRLLKVFKDNHWSRIAITSPTKGCGKTFVAANLALSMARQTDARTVLVDMDLKLPGLASVLGITTPSSIEWYLSGQTPPEAFFRRVGRNLAIGVNTERVRDSAELIQDQRTKDTLARARELLKPDVVIFDLPPMLSCDDAIAFFPQVDCVLLVAAAGQTKPAEIDQCERLLGESTNFLGVLLNKCDSKLPDAYSYGYYG